MSDITGAAKFASFKDKARRLIHQDAQKDSHIIKERIADRTKLLNNTVNDQYADLMPSYGNTSLPSVQPQNQISEEVGAHGQYLDDVMANKINKLRESANISKMSQDKKVNINAANTKLPKEILESFQNTQLDYDVFSPSQSILDKLGITGDSYAVNEEKMVDVPQQMPQQQKVIDYEIIKSIVESAVKKYVGALGKKMLNENKQTQQNDELRAIKLGNKFSFITSNGDLYEAKLVFKKNINEK